MEGFDSFIYLFKYLISMATGIKHIGATLKKLGKRLSNYYTNDMKREALADAIFSNTQSGDSILIVDDNLPRVWYESMQALYKKKLNMVVVDFTGILSKRNTEAEVETKEEKWAINVTWLGNKTPVKSNKAQMFTAENNEQVGWLLKNLFTSAVKTGRSSKIFLFGADEFLQSKAGKEALRFCLAGGSDDRTVGRELCWKFGISIVAFVLSTFTADEQVLGLFDKVTSFREGWHFLFWGLPYRNNSELVRKLREIE